MISYDYGKFNKKSILELDLSHMLVADSRHSPEKKKVFKIDNNFDQDLHFLKSKISKVAFASNIKWRG